MTKRILALLLTGIMAASLFVGCGDSGATTPESDASVEAPAGSEASASSTATEPASGDVVNVTVLCGYASEDPHGQYVYQYAEEFNAANPNIKVEIQAISTNDIYTKLAAMATNPADIPTLFYTSADQAATLYDLGMTEDLHNHVSQEIRDGFANGAYEATVIDGQMAFYPINVQPLAVIYRKDRFEEAGLSVPTTWDQFVEASKALTADTDGDGENDQWGFSMVGSNNSSGQSRFMSYLWSNGYDLAYQEDGVWKTDITADAAFVDVFARWTNMNAEGVVPTGITEVDYATSANYFAMGYTNIFLTGSNALGVAYANNPELTGKLGSFPMPGDAPGTMLNAEGYAMSAHASDEQKAAATQFLTFFTSNDSEMKFWNASGKIPSTLEGQTVAYLAGEDYAGYLQQIEKGCRPTMTFPGVAGLKSALGNAYAAVFSGEKDNQQAVEDLVKEVTELLEDYN